MLPRIHPTTKATVMAKGQQKSNRETKKPKKAAPPKPPAGGSNVQNALSKDSSKR